MFFVIKNTKFTAYKFVGTLWGSINFLSKKNIESIKI